MDGGRYFQWMKIEGKYILDNFNTCSKKFLTILNQEIFRGDTQHTVTEGTNSLNLRLSPLLDDRELTVPRITRINRPFQMVASTSDNITVAVDTVKKDGSSAVDGTLSYRFRSVDNDSLPLDNITGGSFSSCFWRCHQVRLILPRHQHQPILHLIMTAR